MHWAEHGKTNSSPQSRDEQLCAFFRLWWKSIRKSKQNGIFRLKEAHLQNSTVIGFHARQMGRWTAVISKLCQSCGILHFWRSEAVKSHTWIESAERLLLHSFTIQTDVLSDEPSVHESANTPVVWSKHIEQATYSGVISCHLSAGNSLVQQTEGFPWQWIGLGLWGNEFLLIHIEFLWQALMSCPLLYLHRIICYLRGGGKCEKVYFFFPWAPKQQTFPSMSSTCMENKMYRRNKRGNFISPSPWPGLGVYLSAVCAHLPLSEKKGI